MYRIRQGRSALSATLKIFAIFVMAVCITSCGGKKESTDNEDVVLTSETENQKVEGSDSNSTSYDGSETADNSSVSDSESADVSDSEDWDALLNSYEEYVNQYIAYVKKAAKGDATALAEYPSLMEKAQEFSEKMQGAKGDMSSAQWARYMRITNKMASAALN